MSISEKQVVGELVAHDYRAATVFKQYDIDFCCNGNISIGQVCSNKHIDPKILIENLENAMSKIEGLHADYQSWPIDLLADFIEKRLHKSVLEKTAEISPYLNKICDIHVGQHPELLEIKRLFDESAEELAIHMKKEEQTLFPFVREAVKASQAHTTMPAVPFGSIDNPLHIMMQEHDSEGDRFRQIAVLSNQYTPPPDACGTYRLTFKLLKEFEEDLHLHIHLENNILFPKTIKMEASLLEFK